MLKIIRRLAIGVFGAVAVALIVGFFWLKSSTPALNGARVVAGLQEEASIVRDEYGIPHIFAESLDDAYAALGYAHAQDRLAQMEFLRWVSQGRLAEKVGPSGVDTDKLSRTLNLIKIGRLSEARADDRTKRAFQKYADGVNAFIASHKGAWPLEFVLLGATPEPWSASDIFTLSGVILFSVPDWRDELVYADFAERLSADQMNDFFPAYPKNAPVTYSNNASPNEASRNTPARQGHAGWPFARGGFASNTWAVHGSKTKSGMPLLASDPHGGLTAPIDYYLTRIEGPGFSLRGVGAPGFPALLLGHNSHIAWGLTDIGADISDLYLKRRVGDTSYQGPDGPLPFASRKETINVKGGDAIVIDVRETRHGPVISDVNKRAAAYAARFGPDYVVSLSVEASHRGIAFTSALLDVNRAQNWNDFVAALVNYDFQHNFSYADRFGNIGMVSAARAPSRPAENGHLPKKGWLVENDWSDVTPVASILRETNPTVGFIANANNRLTPHGSPFEASSSPSPHYRIKRIVELLSAKSDFDAESMTKVQSDTISLAAKELSPLMTKIDGSSDLEKTALEMLRQWNGDMDADRPQPLIYAAWLEEFSKRAFSDDLGPLFDEWHAPREHVVSSVLQDRPQWCNHSTANAKASCAPLLAASLSAAVESLADKYGKDPRKWRYGAAHQAHFKHQIFTSIPLVSSFSDARVAVGGDDRTINAANVSYSEESLYGSTFGARYRQVIDLNDVNNSRFMLAPGISGNIFSPFYKNLVQKWADTEYITLAGDEYDVSQRGAGHIKLLPE